VPLAGLPAGFPFADEVSLPVQHSPAESLRRLQKHIRSIVPHATDAQILKMLG